MIASNAEALPFAVALSALALVLRHRRCCAGRRKGDPAGNRRDPSYGWAVDLSAPETSRVLKLTLRASSYDWQFVPEAGATFTDSGSAPCH